MLELEGIYDITVAGDGQEAYHLVRASMERGLMFNLILMDIQVRLRSNDNPDSILT